MSILTDVWPEPDVAEVAQRLRMYMGDKKLSRKALAEASGISRTSLGTKLDGDVPFTVDEILAVARAINRSWVWVLTGIDSNDPGPPSPYRGWPSPLPTQPNPVRHNSSHDDPETGKPVDQSIQYAHAA
jgi:transcriptional regulator with XRE-family HTH domain